MVSIYLFLGNDNERKEAKIEQIKKNNLSRETEDFNFDILYSKEVSPPKLKEVLNSLPTNTKKSRFIVIKNPEEFSSLNKEIILAYLKNPKPFNTIIFDTQEFDIRDNPFFLTLAKSCQVVNFQRGREFNTFDLGRAINQGNARLALEILSGLLSRGEKSTLILGSLNSQWSRNYDKPRLLKGYQLILEADRAIKTGRLKPKLALESLVLRLTAGLAKPFH